MAAKKKKKRAAKKRKPATKATTKKRKRKSSKRLPKNLAAAMAAFSGESRHDDSPKKLSKKERQALTQAAMAAWSGESRHSDVSAPAASVLAKKRLTKKERAQLLKAAMSAYSGESRHGPQAEFERNMRLWEIAQGARRRQLSNPRRRRRKAASASKNPIHFPKGPRGRPAKKSYWILDVYKGSRITTYIGERPVDKSTAKLMAMQRLNRAKADKVALSGPYRTKPMKSALRK